MLTFVTSLRSPKLSDNWPRHVWLLERAVGSMLSQLRGECRIVVGCHDVPQSALAHDSRVQFVVAEFPPPTKNNDDMCVDKVLKLTIGSQRAIEDGCDYIAFSDADDLVSNRIGGFVSDHGGGNGWYNDAVMFHAYGTRFLRRHRFPSPVVSPFVIVRADLLRLDAPPFSGLWTEMIKAGGESGYLEMLGRHGRQVYTLAAVGLGHYREFMRRLGYPLETLPFPAAVMINHIESTSHVPGGAGSSYDASARKMPPVWTLSGLKRFAGLARSASLLTPSMRHEFSMPHNRDIPVNALGAEFDVLAVTV